MAGDASKRDDVDRTSPGKAFGELLPQSDRPTPVRAGPDETRAASFPLVGSEVLDVSGAAGARRRNMHDVIHSPDDEIAEQHRGPHEEAAVSFRSDPEAGDAGADLADQFGRSYLQSATTGEDISEIESADDLDTTEMGGPFIEIDIEGNAEQEEDEEETGATMNVNSLDIPTGERGQPFPTSEPPSGEAPAELRKAGLVPPGLEGAPRRLRRKRSRSADRPGRGNST